MHIIKLKVIKHSKGVDDMSVIALTKHNFNQEVLDSAQTVLVDFWAPWCGPCRMVSPIVDEIAEDASPSLKVAKVNIDDEPELAQQFGVMSIPTLLVFQNGKVSASSVGARPKSFILDLIENAQEN